MDYYGIMELERNRGYIRYSNMTESECTSHKNERCVIKKKDRVGAPTVSRHRMVLGRNDSDSSLSRETYRLVRDADSSHTRNLSP